jgi:hypothetical protein
MRLPTSTFVIKFKEKNPSLPSTRFLKKCDYVEFSITAHINLAKVFETRNEAQEFANCIDPWAYAGWTMVVEERIATWKEMQQ